MFQPGDKVFAKMKGFPYWPARVDPVPPHVEVPKGKLPVFFYGTHQVSFLPSKSLVSFEANRESYGNRKNLAKAMEEIDLDPDILFLGKDPSAESFWESMYPRSTSQTVEQKPQSRSSSRSTSPQPRKAPKRKPAKTPRSSAAKRRQVEANDDNDSLSSLSDLEDMDTKVASLDVDALKKGLFSKMEPVSEKQTKATKRRKRQASRDKMSPVKTKRSKACENDTADVSSVDSDVQKIHSKVTSDIEASPVETEVVKASADELQQSTKPSRTHSLSSLVDDDNSLGLANDYAPKAEHIRESGFRRKRAVSSLSDSDEKSFDEDLFRNENIKTSPPRDENVAIQTQDNDDVKSNGGVSIRSVNKSDHSEKASLQASPDVEKFNELTNGDNKVVQITPEHSINSDVNEESKAKSETSLAEDKVLSPPKSYESDKSSVDLDDIHQIKTGKNRNHKRIRRVSVSESESGRSSHSSVIDKPIKKRKQKFERKSREIADIKRKKSVERKEDKSSVSQPVDTIQLLRNLVFKLKSSLLRGHENYTAAVSVLEHVRTLPITLLQLTEVWELADCVKKCKKYRPSEEVRSAACQTMIFFKKIQSEATKEELIKVKAILEERNKARNQHQIEQQEPTKFPDIKLATEATPVEVVVELQTPNSVSQSPKVNSSPDQSQKRKFSLEALRAELDEKANSVLARIAATEARLKADRTKKSTSNEATPKIPSSSSNQSAPHRKVEKAFSLVDEVASRLTVDLDAGPENDPNPPPPPPPLPLPSQNRLVPVRSQSSASIDLDTRISQLMGVVTPTTTSPKPQNNSVPSSEATPVTLLALREEIKRKRKAAAERKRESIENSQKDKSEDDVIYDLLGV